MAVTINGSGTITGASIGKILQVVRSTDVTDRSTASTSFTDATGMTITITPTLATSTILVFCSVNAATDTGGYFVGQITNAANTALSGAENQTGGDSGGANQDFPFVMIGRDAPGSTAAVTYKMRFKRSNGTTAVIRNATTTGQMIAMEVAA